MEKLFLVWYDSALSEILSIEKEFSTKALESQLSAENIEVCEIYAENFKLANKKFLENFENLKPNAQIMSASYDYDVAQHIQSQAWEFNTEEIEPNKSKSKSKMLH